MDRPLLDIEALDVTIGEVTVVQGLTLHLQRGQSLGILGPNGIGKTTLLKTLAGLHRPDRGRLSIDGRGLVEWPRRQLARRLGMLLQHTHYAFEASCEDTALIGRHPHLGALQRESDRDRELARRALTDVGLADFAGRSCMTLSGGETRRLALAALLVQDPDLMLLDEPTNHLDPAHQVAVLDILFKQISQRDRAAVMALHDPNLAACYCSHVLLIHGQGEWALGRSEDLLDAERLSRLYGCRIRCVSDGDQEVFAIGKSG
jgi:iron complex transport system ATP-binding protein